VDGIEGDSMKIDDTGCKIVEILEENGRIPNNEIATRLSISEGTVRNRLRKMMEAGYLRVRGLINPNMQENKEVIFILVRIARAKEWDAIAKKVIKLPHVKSVSMIAGRFDFIVEVLLEPHNLIEFISEHLTKIEHILSTESLIAVKTYNKWV
jgi:Lrp/AsnC family transcriptional regulator for asnA, asnC and gidA